MKKQNETTFNGFDTGSDATGTITYKCYPHPVYDEPCHTCHGVGHIHCEECKKESPCPHCNGSGKEHVYEGSVYKVFWNVPYLEPCKPNTTC